MPAPAVRLPVAYDGFGVSVYHFLDTTGDGLQTNMTLDGLLEPEECEALAKIAGQRRNALLAAAAAAAAAQQLTV